MSVHAHESAEEVTDVMLEARTHGADAVIGADLLVVAPCDVAVMSQCKLTMRLGCRERSRFDAQSEACCCRYCSL